MKKERWLELRIQCAFVSFSIHATIRLSVLGFSDCSTDEAFRCYPASHQACWWKSPSPAGKACACSLHGLLSLLTAAARRRSARTIKTRLWRQLPFMSHPSEQVIAFDHVASRTSVDVVSNFIPGKRRFPFISHIAGSQFNQPPSSFEFSIILRRLR